MPASPLPIDPLVPEIVQALERGRNAVLVAEPGAGKTTRLPPALLQAEFARGREIWVLQPRRVAAKLAAQRVAGELGGRPGGLVGYQFRFEQALGPETRLRFLTDGMLLPLARQDPALGRVAAVVLDEFHERSLAMDMGLGWLKRLQQGPRADLRLLVMSATLDADALGAYLAPCPVFRGRGRAFPVEVEYAPFPELPGPAERTRAGVALALRSAPAGASVLAFLPGQREIHRALGLLRPSTGGFELHGLYGDLSPDEQQRVLAPVGGPRIILSTSLAETSVTVPGVSVVLDSGLARRERSSSWSGFPGLVTLPASQASAEQRAGRAGRLGPGRCLRLYSRYDFEHRAAFDPPEVQRADLARALLDLLSLQAGDPASFPWLSPPPQASLAAGLDLLGRLGALEPGPALSPLGREMAALPLHPRLGRFLVQARSQFKGRPAGLAWACRLAALVAEERAEEPDLLEALARARPEGRAAALEAQLRRRLGLQDSPAAGALAGLAADLSKALLAGFPDRVARRRPLDKAASRARENQGQELLMADGGTVSAPASLALFAHHETFAVVEARLGADARAREGARVQSALAVEEDWLLDLFPEGLKEAEDLAWNREAGRVEGFRRLQYGQLVLDEKPLASGSMGAAAEELLFRQALAAGPRAYCEERDLEQFLARAAFCAGQTGDPACAALGPRAVEEALQRLCRGRSSLRELRDAGLARALEEGLPGKSRALLARLAPTHLSLPSGRRLALNYEPGKPPWAQSRLQDFFGMRESPRVGDGRVAVVLHLLAPSQRPLQVTADLAGFWERHYPELRRQLARRYPKHRWPENPA